MVQKYSNRPRFFFCHTGTTIRLALQGLALGIACLWSMAATAGITYSSYTGAGTSQTVARDSAGNMYLLNYVYAGNLTGGRYSTVTKFSPDGAQVLAQVKLPDSRMLDATVHAADDGELLYVVGATLNDATAGITAGSADSVWEYENPKSGATHLGEGIVVALSTSLTVAGSDGTPDIRYASYLGGKNLDGATRVLATDAGIFVAGETESPDFPAASDAFATARADVDYANGFIARLTFDLSRIEASIVVGTSRHDTVNGFAAGPAGLGLLLGSPFVDASVLTDGASIPPAQGITCDNTDMHGKAILLSVDDTLSVGNLVRCAGFLPGALLPMGQEWLVGGTVDETVLADPGVYDGVFGSSWLDDYDIFLMRFSSDFSAVRQATYLPAPGTERLWALRPLDDASFMILGEAAIASHGFNPAEDSYQYVVDDWFAGPFIATMQNDLSRLNRVSVLASQGMTADVADGFADANRICATASVRPEHSVYPLTPDAAITDISDVNVNDYNGMLICLDAAMTPAVAAVPNPLVFGDVAIGSTAEMSLTLTTKSPHPLYIAGTTVTQTDFTDVTDFQVTGGTCLVSGIAADAPCTLTLSYTPTRNWLQGGTLTVFTSFFPDGDISVADRTTFSLQGTGVGEPSFAAGGWFTQRGSFARNGVVDATLPQPPKKTWTFENPAYLNYQAPVLGADGTVYVTANGADSASSGFLLALTGATGALKWACPLSGAPNRAVATVGSDGAVYVVSAGSGSAGQTLLRVAANGVVDWSVDMGGNFYSENPSPVITPGDVLYAGTSIGGPLAVFAASGQIFDAGYISSSMGGALALDETGGRLYVPHPFGIYTMTFPDTSLRVLAASQFSDRIGPPTVGPDETVFYTGVMGSASGEVTLRRAAASGEVLWETAVSPAVSGGVSPVVVTPDGKVITATDNGIGAWNLNGVLLWKSPGAPRSGELAVTADAKVLTLSRSVSVLDATTGRIRWSLNRKGLVDGGAVASDGGIIVSSDTSVERYDGAAPPYFSVSASALSFTEADARQCGAPKSLTVTNLLPDAGYDLYLTQTGGKAFLLTHELGSPIDADAIVASSVCTLEGEGASCDIQVAYCPQYAEQAAVQGTAHIATLTFEFEGFAQTIELSGAVTLTSDSDVTPVDTSLDSGSDSGDGADTDTRTEGPGAEDAGKDGGCGCQTAGGVIPSLWQLFHYL